MFETRERPSACPPLHLLSSEPCGTRQAGPPDSGRSVRRSIRQCRAPPRKGASATVPGRVRKDPDNALIPDKASKTQVQTVPTYAPETHKPQLAQTQSITAVARFCPPERGPQPSRQCRSKHADRVLNNPLANRPTQTLPKGPKASQFAAFPILTQVFLTPLPIRTCMKHHLPSLTAPEATDAGRDASQGQQDLHCPFKEKSHG